MQYLKQNTAYTDKLGPFLDSTDGNTEETALSLAQADIRLSKNGGAFAQTNNVAGATHDANGWYGVPLDATDTNTVGKLIVSIHKTGALAVWKEYFVLPANIYDSLVGADLLDVNLSKVNETAQTARDLGAQLDATVSSRAPEAAGNVAAIKAKTDQLAFTIANKVDASIQAAGDFAQAAADKVWATAARTLTAFSTTLALSVWDVLVANIVTASSIGIKLKNWVLGTDNKVLLSTDSQAGVTIPTVTAVTNDVGITQAGADKAWGTAARALTDKAGFSLSAAGIDAIFDEDLTGHTTASTFGLWLTRLYQYFNNKLNITDATGAAALRNAGDSANIATWTITDDDTTTVRGAASWV